MLAVVQGALWAHAGSVAQAAAVHGAEVAASLGSDDAKAQEAATGFAQNAGTLFDIAAQASNDPDAEQVTVTVTGSYPSIFGSLQVTATATTTRERVPG